MRLLLFSNSTNSGESYLEYPVPYIRDFLGPKKLNCAFVPYAAVSFSYDDYLEKVRSRLAPEGYTVESIHNQSNQGDLIRNADCILVGGGNTWHLLKTLQDQNLVEVIRDEVISGTPYIGWSAGSNLACPTIKTTNDMPVIEPDSFDAFGFIPFQINPHYLDANPEGHAGETREARIEEFLEVNPKVYVVGLREGTLLRMEGSELKLHGPRSARIFRHSRLPEEKEPGSVLNYLLGK